MFFVHSYKDYQERRLSQLGILKVLETGQKWGEMLDGLTDRNTRQLVTKLNKNTEDRWVWMDEMLVLLKMAHDSNVQTTKMI